VQSIWIGLLVLAGLFFLQKAGKDWGRARRSLRWPHVEGVVEETWVRIERDATRDPGDPQQAFYYPCVRYRYQVNGQTYTGERIHAGATEGWPTRGAAEEVLQPYPQGTTVRVYYDPRNPAEALLEPGNAGSVWVLLVFGFGAFALAAWLAWK